MGCVSSKIITKSASFRDEWNRLSFQRKGKGLDDIIITEGTVRKNNDIGIISTWKLLSDLEDGNGTEEHSSNKDSTLASTSDKSVILEDSISLSRSFRTIDEFDALMASSNECKLEKLEPEQERINGGGMLKGNLTTEKCSRRKAIAKNLEVLKVPVFEFPKARSLKEWVLIGGEVFSPGTYDTPKFGNFASRRDEYGDNVDVFHPELVAEFEQDMEKLTMEEDCIIETIMRT